MWTGMRAVRLGAAILCGAGGLVGVSSTAASAAHNEAPIVIGMISDETGPAASSYIDAEDGAQARIDAQNAAGGVDGHKLQLVVQDDQSTPAGNLIAAQTMVQDKDAFAVIENSSFTFGGATYLNKQGIPVVGAEVDGPEWGQKPNTNMFSIDGTGLTPYNGKLYTYNDLEVAFKQLGITRLAQVVINVPSAIDGANSLFSAAKPLGISKCLEQIIPVNDVSFTTFALQMKALKCNGIATLGILSNCIAVQTAVKQAGLKAPDFCATGYDQSVLSQPSALAAMQGTYASATINVLGNDINAPTKLFLSRLKKYTSWPGGIPNLNIDYSYESADLIIKGLELTGSHPTRQAFISDLRKVSSYTAGGLLASPGDNFTHFGSVAALPKTHCGQLLEVKGSSYIPAFHGKPVCGQLVASGTG